MPDLRCRVAIAGALCTFAGCPALTPRGQRVYYIENDSGRFRGCKALGQIATREARYRIVDTRGGRSYFIALRNRAAELGGTHINVLEVREPGIIKSPKVTAEVFRCAIDVGGLR